MVAKISPRPSTSAPPIKRTDSVTSELETAFLKQPFLEQRLERNKQRAKPTKWLRFESAGRTTFVTADKHAIAVETGVQLRDLRLLDPQLATSYPSAILARDRALVLNLEFIKAVVTIDCVLILNPEEQNALAFVEALGRRLLGREAAASGVEGSGGVNGKVAEDELGLIAGDLLIANDSPFELRALEVALDMVCRYLAQQAADLEAAAHPALDALTRKVTTVTLERVRRVKTRLVRLKTRVETMKELLAKFLEDDADMKDLNLTARAADAQQRTRSLLERVSMDASGGAERDGFADRQAGFDGASPQAEGTARGNQQQWGQRQQASQAERAGSSSHMQKQQAGDGVSSRGDEHPGGSIGGDGQAAISGQPSGSVGSSRLQDSAFGGSGRGEWSVEDGGEDADAFPGPEHPHSPQPGSPAALLAEEEADERARAEEEVIDVVEQLLEAYCMQISGTENKLANLAEYIEDTDDLVEIDQDNHRNQLIRLDLLATAAMISMSIITVITGLYAMNLKSGASSFAAFYTITLVSIGLCVVSYLGFLWYCWYKKLMFQ